MFASCCVLFIVLLLGSRCDAYRLSNQSIIWILVNLCRSKNIILGVEIIVVHNQSFICRNTFFFWTSVICAWAIDVFHGIFNSDAQMICHNIRMLGTTNNCCHCCKLSEKEIILLVSCSTLCLHAGFMCLAFAIVSRFWLKNSGITFLNGANQYSTIRLIIFMQFCDTDFFLFVLIFFVSRLCVYSSIWATYFHKTSASTLSIRMSDQIVYQLASGTSRTLSNPAKCENI